MFQPTWIERALRSMGKVVSWRATVTLSNFVGAWWVSGSLMSGLGFAGFALVVNSVLYYFHERTWNRIEWGKEKNLSTGE
jgi:uncharacterized membrane protein